ncbi:MAG: metallophosphoesterase family protein [Desulfurivibrio sp.]
MRRTFAIGDIHGCRPLLAGLLKKIRPDSDQDTLIILGDFINRGPDSRGTVELLLELKRQFRHLILLRGNHEQMLLDFLDGRNQGLFLAVGGRETLASYGADPSTAASTAWLPPEHLALLADLPTCYENEHGIYVHAGLQPGVNLAGQSSEWLLWARDDFIESDHDFGKRVIFGHTPFADPLVMANKIGIDTGAVYGGRLTCLLLPELKFVSVVAAAGTIFPGESKVSRNN